MIVWLYAQIEVEAQSQIFLHQTFYIKKSYVTATSGVVVVLYLKSYTYNYAVNGQWALISPKLETPTIIWRRREYLGM